MMVEKFYAYYKGNKIDAYEGRRKKIRREIQTTPVSKAELFDSLDKKDRYPVTPKKSSNSNGSPYFAYYPNCKPPGSRLGNKGSKETLAHSLFQDVFIKLPNFKIEDNLDEVTVFVDNVTFDLRKWVDKDHYYIIEVMYRLKETKPYSYYYKWNGYLALEISVTTNLSKDKIEYLSKIGIQICELTVSEKVVTELREAEQMMKYRSEQIFEDANIKDAEEADFLALEAEHSIYQKKFEKYYKSYSSNKYRAFAKLLGSVNTEKEWEEKYVNMKRYEQQEEDMKRRIEKQRKELIQLTNLSQISKNEVQQLEKDKLILNSQKNSLIQEKGEVIDLETKNASLENENNKLERNMVDLNLDINKLKEENQSLKAQLKKIEKENIEPTQRKPGFLSRIFK
ncbi:hypothetical protein ABE869_17515 [Enterococcus gilvus]|uniref:hypothetical protein n=1 Tax=Enterococcus gilvus TaxID=160453 RepID=UPI003D6A6C3B